jgi:hypothetical protein
LTGKVTKDAQKVRLVGRLQTALGTNFTGAASNRFRFRWMRRVDLMFLPEPAVGIRGRASDDDAELEVRKTTSASRSTKGRDRPRGRDA